MAYVDRPIRIGQRRRNGISFWILYHNDVLMGAKISNRIESFMVLSGANPAIRCNLYLPKGSK